MIRFLKVQDLGNFEFSPMAIELIPPTEREWGLILVQIQLVLA